MEWTYKIYNNKKILHYATIKNNVTGINLNIPYEQLADKSFDVAKHFITEIVNKLNK